MNNDITPTQKLELANELIDVINRYCEKTRLQNTKPKRFYYWRIQQLDT